MATSETTSERVGRRSITGIAAALLLTPGCFFADGDDDDAATGDAGDGDVPDPEPQPEPLQEEPFTDPCVPDAWIVDGDAGVPVTFALEGTEVVVTGDAPMGIEAVPAPFSVKPSPNGGEPLVVFADATLDGELVGTVVITGATIHADTGSLSELAVDSATMHEHAVYVALLAAEDDGTRPQLGATADPLHVDALANAQPIDLRMTGISIDAYTTAYVVTPEGNVPLMGTFEISAERVYWPAGTEIQTAVVDARFAGEVFIGLAAQSGEFTAAEATGSELPMAILGRDGHLRFGPTTVSTLEGMSVQQAMDAEDVLLASQVELRSCQAETLVFYSGQTRKLRFAYRQPGHLTDAVFANVVVNDAAGAMWTTRIEVDPTLPSSLTTAAEENSDTSWGSGLIGFVEAWGEAIQTITEGLVCVFTFGFLCPDDDSSSEPDPLLMYPAWMEAGDVGEFELEIAAPPTAGTYDIVVTITGENYEATVPAHVIVQ
jgi:hypothetical protein